jgi:predicted PurR-regulated permease PerM
MSPIERYLPQLSENAARWVRFFAVLAGAAVFVWLCAALSAVLTPMVAGFAIAYILNPAVRWLEERRRIPRVVSVSVGLAILLLCAAVLVFAGAVQLLEFFSNLPRYLSELREWLRSTVPLLFAEPTHPSSRPAGLRTDVTNWAQSHAADIARGSILYLGGIFSNVFYWGSVVVLLPMYTFFFLLNFDAIVRAVRDHLPERYRDTILRIVSTIDRSISNFFRGRLIVCVLVGTCMAIGWTIVGVRYSLPLGAMAGILNLIPFMSILALPPVLILTYAEAVRGGESWIWPVLLAMAVYVGAQALESFVLSPIVESRTSGLHPVTTVVVLLIGNQAAGLLGMLLAIPIASTLKSLAIEYALPELRRLAAARNAGPEPPPGATSEAVRGDESNPASTVSPTGDSAGPESKK